MSVADDDFIAFAQARAERLRHRAFLLCQDWHLAQDLTQITLAKLYASWRKAAAADNLEAYAAKVMLRAFLDHRRRRSASELPSDTLPEHSTSGPEPELRLTLIDALGRLPPRDRAIVVLRYWEDHSVETVADILGVRPGVVKTQAMRSLARLRSLLGSDVDLLRD
ncbi:SigE family RNA polymerase sigma factor [Planosporangium sp. 12N6]|uniref:SigE family RNA polymerase sigma factor n=1 Tax=Planosporangium spinosum TaxID=3402278 RepID=UPI003CF089A0